MSGEPSWATTEPSRNSTRPWITDCGWTTTSSASGPSANRWWASISSRPLFIRVAELIVIFGPIVQVGCLSACSTVTLRIASSDQVRNGPPEAVRTMRRTSSRRPAPSAWKIALCSESTGRTVAPAAAARRMNSAPAQTRHSLLASATVAPRSAAASVGLRLVAPVIAAITQSAGRCAASTTASAPAAASMPEPDSSALSSPYSVGIGDGGKARAELARQLRKRGGVAMRGHRLDPIALGILPQQIDRARTDRAGRAQQASPCAATGANSTLCPRLLLLHRLYHTSKPRAGAADPLTNDADEERGKGGDQEPVEAIHQSAMAGNEMARILRAETPLDRGFEQVAGLRQDRKHTTPLPPTIPSLPTPLA